MYKRRSLWYSGGGGSLALPPPALGAAGVACQLLLAESDVPLKKLAEVPVQRGSALEQGTAREEKRIERTLPVAAQHHVPLHRWCELQLKRTLLPRSSLRTRLLLLSLPLTLVCGRGARTGPADLPSRTTRTTSVCET